MTAPGAHAVAVDPANGEVLVPLNSGSGNDVCAKGRIGVYNVPEPSSLALMLSGLVGLFGFGFAYRRRRHDIAT